MPPLGIYYARVAGKLSQARVRRTLVLLGLFLAMILAANFQRQYRRTTVVEDIQVQVTDSDFFSQCVYAVAVQEKEKRYFHDSVFLHIISGPVPRFLWQDKPKMHGMWVFTEYLWGKDTSQVGGNTQPSVVGEYYTNWGWWGVLEVGLVLGLIVRLLDIAFGACGPRDMARFGILGVMAYFFCSFRFLSFAFFPVAVMTVVVGMIMARFRWFTGESRPGG